MRAKKPHRVLDNVRVKRIGCVRLLCLLVLLSSWSRDECRTSLRPRLADPPLPRLVTRRDSARRVRLVTPPTCVPVTMVEGSSGT